MIGLLQLAAIVFAGLLAAHNAPSVSQFEHGGIRDVWMARFHRYGWWTKLAFCGAVTLEAGGIVEAIFFGLLSALWIWLVFDPVLNLTRVPKRKWHYLGLNDADGRRWQNWFGDAAGQLKALLLLVLILVINFLYLKLPTHALHACPW